MAGWRVGFVVGNAEVVGALARLKSWLDYGTFQPIQIAAIVAMNELPDYPREVSAIYQSRRDALCDGLARAGWSFPKPKGTMFVWAPIPERFRALGSLAFAEKLAREASVAVSPGDRLRRRRRRVRPLRARRERAPHRPGGAGDQEAARVLARVDGHGVGSLQSGSCIHAT